MKRYCTLPLLFVACDVGSPIAELPVPNQLGGAAEQPLIVVSLVDSVSYVDQDGDGTETLNVGSDGAVFLSVDYGCEWILDEQLVSDSCSATLTFSLGEHRLTLRATDRQSGQQAVDSMKVSVLTAPEPVPPLCGTSFQHAWGIAGFNPPEGFQQLEDTKWSNGEITLTLRVASDPANDAERDARTAVQYPREFHNPTLLGPINIASGERAWIVADSGGFLFWCAPDLLTLIPDESLTLYASSDRFAIRLELYTYGSCSDRSRPTINLAWALSIFRTLCLE